MIWRVAFRAIWHYNDCRMANTISTPNGPTITDLLGGKKVLGVIEKPLDIRGAIRAGFPYAALESLATILCLRQRDVSEVVGLPARTLARRKQEQRLSPVESDRVYRLARITQLATETLGDFGKARAWLSRPNRALGGETPLAMLDTEIGARQVGEVLLHISYGIYA
jgi:putative toxin-antitoxin system antitoxin component (TIGR02293 family)